MRANFCSTVMGSPLFEAQATPYNHNIYFTRSTMMPSEPERQRRPFSQKPFAGAQARTIRARGIMAESLASKPGLSLNDPAIQRQVNELRQTDNVKGWYYVAREYLFLALVVSTTIIFYEYLQAAEL